MSLILSLFAALWLGLVTSISPCPLATNVAAISYLSRKAERRKSALLGALSYTLGRVCAYGGIALILFVGLASMPAVSEFLRNGIQPFLGPILILGGMVIGDLLPIKLDIRSGNNERMKKVAEWGLLGEFCIGVLFALSFCPISAGLFFGSLMPMAVASPVPPMVILAFGLGTALPVGVVALTIVFSIQRASRLLAGIQGAQKILTHLTAVVLILVGLYLTFSSVLGR